MMKNILITGGGGYIGSHTAKIFLEAGFPVTIFDNFKRGHKGATKVLKQFGDLEVFEGDLRNKEDLKKVFNSKDFDAVIHFAGLIVVSESMEKPELYFENNFVGTLNLLNAMNEAGVKKIVFSSTCATYGDTQYLPVDENHPQNPTNPYAESKLMVEKALKWFDEIYGVKSIILRYFNVCGADESGDLGYACEPSTHLVPNAVKGALGMEKFYLTSPKVDTEDGTPIRDYVDVLDLGKAHLLAYEYLTKEGASDVFNLGNGTGYSVLQIIEAIESHTGKEIERSKGEARKGEYGAIYADNSKAKEKLGWEPERTLEDSIENLTLWYQKHPGGF